MPFIGAVAAALAAAHSPRPACAALVSALRSWRCRIRCRAAQACRACSLRGKQRGRRALARSEAFVMTHTAALSSIQSVARPAGKVQGITPAGSRSARLSQPGGPARLGRGGRAAKYGRLVQYMSQRGNKVNIICPCMHAKGQCVAQLCFWMWWTTGSRLPGRTAYHQAGPHADTWGVLHPAGTSRGTHPRHPFDEALHVDDAPRHDAALEVGRLVRGLHQELGQLQHTGALGLTLVLGTNSEAAAAWRCSLPGLPGRPSPARWSGGGWMRPWPGPRPPPQTAPPRWSPSRCSRGR